MNQSKEVLYLLGMNSKSKHIDGGEEGKCCILNWAQNMNEIGIYNSSIYPSRRREKKERVSGSGMQIPNAAKYSKSTNQARAAPTKE